MIKLKFLTLIFFLTITQNCICQMGPTLGVIGGSKDNYKVTTLIFSGINATITTFNIVNYNKLSKTKSNAGFGLVTGLSQLAYGLIFKDDCPVEDRTIFLTMNIGLGTLAILTSTLRLTKKKQKTDITTWNVFYRQTKADNFEFGITMTKKI